MSQARWCHYNKIKHFPAPQRAAADHQALTRKPTVAIGQTKKGRKKNHASTLPVATRQMTCYAHPYGLQIPYSATSSFIHSFCCWKASPSEN